MAMVGRQLAGVAVCVAMASGCGGKQPAPATVVDDGDREVAPDPNANSAQMVPPEKMEEIRRNLDRRRRIVSRCLSDEIDNGNLPKGSRGKVTLEIVIAPSGHADTVKVIRSTLESPGLESCVINHVKEIQFPTLPKPYPTSYSYAFEAS